MADVRVERLVATVGKGIKQKRVRDSEGRLVVIRTIDADSIGFGSELRDIFAKNVSKARKANKAAVGFTDRGRDQD